MKFYKAVLIRKRRILPDTYIFLLKIKGKNNYSFSPGQYVFLKNPLYEVNTPHLFSIASSPKEKKHLEFCIKIYGNWTKNLSVLKKGFEIEISSAMGNFVWDTSVEHAVFLLGGIGISPVISMLRFLSLQDKKPLSITILYGNRTPETIAYKKELRALSRKLPIKIIDIFSEIPKNHPWKGYRGFITQHIVEKESALENKPTFFIVGPPIFIEKMTSILSRLAILAHHIKKEVL